MDPQTIGLLAFGAMLLLILIGIPIGFSMLVTAAAGFFLVGGPTHAEDQLSVTFFEPGTNFIMVAVPLYFLMGQLVFRTAIATDLYDSAHRLLGRLPGGLGIPHIHKPSCR